MDDHIAKGAAFAVLVATGSLIVFVFRKFNVSLKRIYWIGGITYCIGLPLVFIGKDENETSLFMVGIIFMALGGAVGIYWLFVDLPSQPQKRNPAPIETRFSYRLGQRLGKYVSRKKSKPPTSSLQKPKRNN